MGWTYEEWKKEAEERNRKIKEEVKDLISTTPFEDLEKRFLRDFGCINFQSDEFNHELDLARCFHKYHEGLHPELHKHYSREPYRCYHVTGCSCGFCEACDSSD